MTNERRQRAGARQRDRVRACMRRAHRQTRRVAVVGNRSVIYVWWTPTSGAQMPAVSCFFRRENSAEKKAKMQLPYTSIAIVSSQIPKN